jgi:hypothetical protein
MTRHVKRSACGPVMFPLLRVLAGCALAGVAGCGGELPSPSLVEDLRVLAVRADPPEVLVDRVDGQATQPGPVSFQALVVDPRGQSMVYQWRFCPVESDETCADFDRRRAAAPAEFQPALDVARAQESAGQSEVIATGPARGVADFAVHLPQNLFRYHLDTSGLGLGNGSWVSAVLDVAAGGETLQVQKRVVLGARDLSQWNPELQKFGWQVCAPGVPAPGCLPLAPRTPNHNPTIAAVEIARSGRADAPFAPRPEGPLMLASGEVIRLRPLLGPDAEERYQTVESTLQANDLVVTDRTEEAVVSWFATAGKFASTHTTPQLTKTLDNTFTAPSSPPAHGRISVFLVVRDQRGGAGWISLEVTMPQP